MRVFQLISRILFLIMVFASGLSSASAQTNLGNCFTELDNGSVTIQCLSMSSNPPRTDPITMSATTPNVMVGDLLVGTTGRAGPVGDALTANGNPGNVAAGALTTNGTTTAGLFLSTPRLQSRPGEVPRGKWLALSIAQHGAATFDAWSTRRALSAGQYQETNPALRPFAGNSSLYAAIQVVPLVFDYLSRRMMTSQHVWMRHAWWVPQALSTAASLGSGAHNLSFH